MIQLEGLGVLFGGPKPTKALRDYGTAATHESNSVATVTSAMPLTRQVARV